MNDTNTYLLSDARKALEKNRLLSAIRSLQGMANILKAWNEAEELDAMSNSYHTLLTYFSKGTSDPERSKMYNRFFCRAYEISDVLERLNELRDGTSFYTTSLRTLQKIKETDHPLLSVLQPDINYKDLFHAVWLSDFWKSEDESAVYHYLSNQSVDNLRKSLTISAITLSCIKFFDAAKLRTLINLSSTETPSIRARVLTGILFIVIYHSERIALYPNVAAQLSLMMDKPGFNHEIELIQAQLFLTLETKRIERNLQEEIIPRMMKRMKDLKLDRSLGIDELKEKLAEADLNPEWDENGQPSKLSQYMQEFIGLQKRGADLYMGTFKMLKQRFPFFREISNWFCPFTFDHPEIPQNSRQNKTLGMLLSNNGLCDSDKYSFCLIADQINHSVPEEALQSMMGSNEVDFNTKLNADNPKQDEFRKCLRSYIQGFYRFCNLYLYNQQFPNPFQKNLFIADYQPFTELLSDESFVTKMADFTFKDQSYHIAKTLFEHIPASHRDATMFQKLGYCYEQEHDFNEAIKLYATAHDLNAKDHWTLKKLSTCHRLNGNYKEALFYYDELAQLYPEDANIAFRQGECHLHLNQFDEAFKGFFKADYLEENSDKVMRALGWCSLLTEKYAQAERYYVKILSMSPTSTDYLNAGHAAWLSGNISLAIERYSASLTQENPENFLKEDSHLLKEKGMTDDDLHIMTDAVLSAHGDY